MKPTTLFPPTCLFLQFASNFIDVHALQRKLKFAVYESLQVNHSVGLIPAWSYPHPADTYSKMS